MKPEDLMIGDWFRVRYTFDGKDFVRTFRISRPIDELGFVCGKGLGQVCLPEELEPIPLTPEILEKNGVVKPKLSLWWLLDLPFRELWLSQHTDGSWWLYSSGDCDKDENFAEIRFVHELQHALKLCGIDKTIVV